MDMKLPLRVRKKGNLQTFALRFVKHLPHLQVNKLKDFNQVALF